MNIKKIKILMVIITFILSFPAHFIYDWFPNIITSIFFPVNESIWEHMKIIYTCILISSFIEWIIYKKRNIKVNNFLINIPIISIIGIVIYLIIYLLLDKLFSHSLFISIMLLLIIYIICEWISYYILRYKKIKNQKYIGIILIIISYIIFAYLTYNPIKEYLFLDTQTNSYGIPK